MQSCVQLGYAPGAGHIALTQHNVHGYWGSTVTVHNIPSGRRTNEGVIEHLVKLSLCMWF